MSPLVLVVVVLVQLLLLLMPLFAGAFRCWRARHDIHYSRGRTTGWHAARTCRPSNRWVSRGGAVFGQAADRMLWLRRAKETLRMRWVILWQRGTGRGNEARRLVPTQRWSGGHLALSPWWCCCWCCCCYCCCHAAAAAVAVTAAAVCRRPAPRRLFACRHDGSCRQGRRALAEPGESHSHGITAVLIGCPCLNFVLGWMLLL